MLPNVALSESGCKCKTIFFTRNTFLNFFFRKKELVVLSSICFSKRVQIYIRLLDSQTYFKSFFTKI